MSSDKLKQRFCAEVIRDVRFSHWLGLHLSTLLGRLRRSRAIKLLLNDF